MAPAMAMDGYRPIGSVFRRGSYHRSRTYRIRTDFPAGPGAWLVVYPDPIALGANFIPWAGECLLPRDVGRIRIEIDWKTNSA